MFSFYVLIYCSVGPHVILNCLKSNFDEVLLMCVSKENEVHFRDEENLTPETERCSDVTHLYLFYMVAHSTSIIYIYIVGMIS